MLEMLYISIGLIKFLYRIIDNEYIICVVVYVGICFLWNINEFIALEPLHNEYILMVPDKDGDIVKVMLHAIIICSVLFKIVIIMCSILIIGKTSICS